MRGLTLSEEWMGRGRKRWREGMGGERRKGKLWLVCKTF